MSNCLAIDIALLPPENVMDAAIAINKSHGPKYNLNKTNRFPHITLSQAIIDGQDLGLAETRLKKVASEFKPLKLKAKLVDKPSTLFEVVETKQLTELHTRIMNDFKDLVFYDVKSDFFYDKFIREQSLDWVSGFRKNAAYKRFFPHISIGITKPVLNQEDINFIVDRLVICHLGDYNTCRKILAEVRLGQNK